MPVGKTAAPEFGILNFARTKAWGVTRNPWNLERTPGGSSSGSAAAVAAGIIPLGTASDGGGSIRIPAAFCGLVGHKASYGRVPHPGPMDSQTSVVGVVATTVADAARCLDVQAGPDDRDRTSLPPPAVTYEEEIETLDVAGLRARWSLDLGFVEYVDPEVAELSRAAAEALAGAAGLELDDEPVHFADATKVWLSSGVLSSWTRDGLGERWPDRADELMPYTRQGDGGVAGHHAPSASGASTAGVTTSRSPSPRSSTRSTCSSCRARRSPPSPPRARRPAGR